MSHRIFFYLSANSVPVPFNVFYHQSMLIGYENLIDLVIKLRKDNIKEEIVSTERHVIGKTSEGKRAVHSHQTRQRKFNEKPPKIPLNLNYFNSILSFSSPEPQSLLKRLLKNAHRSRCACLLHLGSTSTKHTAFPVKLPFSWLRFDRFQQNK